MSGRFTGDEIWVVCETREGKVPGSCLELTGEAARLAAQKKACVAAVLFDGEAESETGLLFAAGADKVYLIRSASPPADDGVFAMAVAFAARRYAPEIILMPATVRGRSIAPQVAARLRTGLTADCTALRLGEDGLLVQIRPAFGGSLMAEVICPEARPQ
ncbi:MAG: electron transfer flavoprotein subunit alpha, partial [Deltaproteobacteria bacterium]|nr:electron transfer flavoprotein subunit alpha [Deltaproteobacteria bacterium]